MQYTIHHGDCTKIMQGIPDASIDAIITDPPYAEIDRDYGRLTEADWWQLMMQVCAEARRVLKPSGSAMFILQPNSRKVGSMRGWVFEFMAWVCDRWNMIQDAYWWNITSLPTVHTHRDIGLMRPSLKPCIWAGAPKCYRSQKNVLWAETARSAAMRLQGNELRQRPSGYTSRDLRMGTTALEREGVTPYNVLPIPNADSQSSSGAHGHGAGTPLALASWWTRYICPPDGTILDPFCGAGTMGIAAIQHGANFIGIEQMEKYADISRVRIGAAVADRAFGLFDAAKTAV